ncbi:MAG: DNA repair protein RecN [Verrucomicrobia bacterium]|nr:DNA repair protein RecN [Verrucomicrobiota bacterium]
MLTTLRIKNLALVADLTLELRPGCNVITGETGAGKSIIIGALNLVLGERADRTLIRAGSDSCAVEAVFDTAKLRGPLASLLDDHGLEPCEENQLVLKRVFTAAGANRQFINGSPTTLATLAAIGEGLVDMHGPHDHQSLLHPAKQLAILDAFGGLQSHAAAFAELVRSRAAVEREKATLIVDEQTYAQQLDLLRHQAHEISTAKLLPGEDAEVEAEHHRASNAARLLELSQAGLGALDGDDTSLLNQLGALGRTLQELQRVDSAASPFAEAHGQITASLRELQSDLSRYADRVDLDPARLAQLEERLNLLHSLRRKYGASLAEVIAFGSTATARLQSLEQRDAELARLNDALAKLDIELARAGRDLTAARRKVIPKLAKAATRQLQDLGFQQSELGIALAPAVPTATGCDAVEFQFAPNPGEPARPLRAIASSGEMARVMLALKTVLAAEDEIPVLVFDEVDANVGGETANAVGEKMRQIARARQVLCITHLAPVAAVADTHFVVTKQVRDGRTLSDIQPLTRPQRVDELARMLGGQGEAAHRHADALLADSR